MNFIIDESKKISTADSSVGFSDFLGTEVLKFGGIVIGLSLLSGFFMYCMRKTIIVMSRLIEYDLRKDIYEKYQTLDLAFYKRNKTGDLMARVSEDVSKVRMYLGPAILYGIRVAFLFTFIIYSMFHVSSTLSWYALLPLPILSISIYYVSMIINKRSTLIQQQVSKLNSIAQEVYSGIRIIKSYAKEDEFKKYFDEQSEDFKDKALNLARVQALFIPLMVLLVSISTLLTIYIGGKLVIAGEITTGNIAEFIIYINMLTWPITSIGWIASLIQQAAASQTRINEILNQTPSIQNKGAELSNLAGTIEFKNVSFTYPDTGILALDNVSFKINKGERVAIVGRTASGKSTLAELLLRFYDVSSGEILIDGQNIKEMNLNNLRMRLGYVPQNIFLFSSTISENIAFGKKSFTEEEVKKFAQIAAVDKDIEDLAEGFKTMVGERGVTLSGGQKQRLSIARALIKDPDIIILDDCLSAVDANTEALILGHLDSSLKGKTAIIITHRISSLLSFDKILVLEQGALNHIGTHEDLIDKEGYYKQIVEYQQQ